LKIISGYISDILVVSGHTSQNFLEDYAEALRYAVGLVRDGINDLEIRQVGTLHSFEEIQAASDALEEHYTDEELIEEVHYASRVRGK
jgi:glycine/D-amino acid oxidase-like deaminating enzyme